MPGKIMLTPASVLEMQLLQIQLPRWGKNYLNLYELIPLTSPLSGLWNCYSVLPCYILYTTF